MARPATTHTAAGMEKICFERGHWIYLADLMTGRETRLVEGKDAKISPNGEWIAFTSVKDDEGVTQYLFPPPGRLRILNLITNQIRDPRDLRDRRVANPVWSTDGSRFAVTSGSVNGKGPLIVVVNTKTGAIEKEINEGWEATPDNEALYLDSWVPENQSILFHTVAALYEWRLHDGMVQKLPVGSLFEEGISSEAQFSLSSNRQYLLFNRIISTPEEPEAGVVYVFDLSSGALRRVTPKGVFGHAPMWLPSSQEILFMRSESSSAGTRQDVCKIGLEGQSLTTLVKNGSFPSYSTK